MEPNICVTLTLPITQAEKVLEFVKSLSQREHVPDLRLGNTKQENEAEGADIAVAPEMLLRFKPGQELRYLLDKQLEQLVRFTVQKEGKFYNDELAENMGIDDPRTSVFLGHLTRKLRKVGMNA